MNNTLVYIDACKFDVVIDLRYAKADNFTGKAQYQHAQCFLHPNAACCLQQAVNFLKPLGLTIKIWDEFRPLAVQQALFDHTPNPEYISHPEWGQRPHPRGVALDVTLVDEFAEELDMGTDFDEFRSLAHHGNLEVNREAQRNRLILAGAMQLAGFEPIESEWWHYQLPHFESYPIVEDKVIIAAMLGE